MSEEEARRTGLPQRIPIPYTLLISALAIVEDVRRCVSMDLKAPGHSLVWASSPVFTLTADGINPNHVGEGTDEPGRFDGAKALHNSVSELIRGGKVHAAHDVSDGGLAVAIAEMCIASGFGASITAPGGRLDETIFAPLATTYILEMSEKDAAESGWDIIGRVEQEPRLGIVGTGARPIDLSVCELEDAWRSPLAFGEGQ